ncbi:MAG: UvrD-helicase domain-containing protein [Acidiferrobacteraceae bacterium]
MKTIDALSPAANAAVLAAAGTGKTWLLTSRILRLLLGGIDPSTILALTFTRKAASEIRARVLARAREFALVPRNELERLLGALGADPSEQTAARGLYEQLLADPRSIQIATFHGFCQSLLRRFPIEAGISPRFDLTETPDRYADMAWRLLLEDARLDRTGALALALEDLSERSGSAAAARSALQAFWAHRADWWAYTDGAEDPVAFAAGRLVDALGPAAEDLPGAGLVEDLTRCLSGFRDIPSLQQHVSEIGSSLTDPAWRDRLHTVFISTTGKPQRFPLPKTERRQLVDAHGLEDAWVRAALAVLDEDRRRRRDYTLRLSVAWYRCGYAFVQHAQRLKAMDRVLDFVDLEWQAYLLLHRGPHAEWVHYKLDQRIEHILVDEFQDTNPTQWQLLLPFVEELAAGDSERHRSIFIVGDEKQSLYRFRGGDARLLAAVSDWLVEHMGAVRFTEDTSRRSSEAITDFVNLLFAPEPDDTPLPSFRPHATARAPLWGRVEVLPLIHEEEAAQDEALTWRNPLMMPRTAREDCRYRVEADRLVHRIRECTRSVVIGEGASAKPARYCDIIVLLRDRGHARSYEDALRAAGIPYAGVDQRELTDALEVRDVLDLLAVLLDPGDDCALAALLRSPFFGHSDHDLMEIAGQARTRGLSWWDVLSAPENLPELSRTREQLGRWIAVVDRVPVHDLLDAIFAEADVIRRYAAISPPEVRTRIAPAFHAVLHLALDMDGGRYPGLARFRAHLATLRSQVTGTRSSAADEVRLLTVHGAKGLEAPIVFLVDTARPGKTDSGVRPLIDRPPLAPSPAAFHLIGKKDVVDDCSHEALARQLLLQQQEDMNALYVAVTRAAQMLVISGCAPKRGTNFGWYGTVERRLRGDRARATGVAWDDGATGNTPCAIIERGEALCAPLPSPSPSTAPGPTSLPRTIVAMPRRDHRPPPTPSGTIGNGVDTAPPRSARVRGEAVHRLLQLRTSGMPTAAAVRRLGYEFPSLSRAILSQCAHEVEKVLDDEHLRQWFDPGRYMWARNEMPLLYLLDDDRVVHGVVDRVIMYADHVDILDYKTHGGIAPSQAQEAAKQYRHQMRCYEEAAHRLWPELPCKSFVLFTALPNAVALDNDTPVS